jgi:cytochrome oxidase Cu insertion factor (SCO1/SenC/PrrC family)
MGRGVSLRNDVVTAHFVSALFFDLAIIMGVVALVVVLVLWRRRGDLEGADEAIELPGRRMLRIGTGALWLLAGLLQLQTSMPMGLASQVVRPSVATAPGWASRLVLAGTDAWIRHPILGATGVVWLEVGLGLWLLLARRGVLSLLAGGASVLWGLVVFVLGTGLGGAFVAPWAWVFGAPGASLLYVAAGVLLALPPSRLAQARTADLVRQLFAVVLLVMAVGQALPSGGFLRSGRSSAFVGMAEEMAGMAQPGATAAIERWFATTATHVGPALDVVVILVLVGTALALLSGRRHAIRSASVVFCLLAAAVWVTVEDFGVLGGVATDANAMPMWIVLMLGTWLLVRDAQEREVDPDPRLDGRDGRTRVAAAAGAVAMSCFGGALLLGVGVLPGSTADAAIAAGGQVSALRGKAPDFTLTDAHGRPFALSSLRGRVVVLSFIDPVCTSECPIEAQEMRSASVQLGAAAPVTFLAINANPRFIAPDDLRAFNQAEGLTDWKAWTFVTGSVAQLRTVWDRYGVSVSTVGAGAMALHSEPVFIIDRTGHLRVTWQLASGDGPRSLEGQSTTSQLVDQVRRAL